MKADTSKNLIPFVKGQSGNPNGRPRKFVSGLKMIGYKQSEINDTIQNILSMTLDELELVFTDEKATVLEKTIASALKKSLKRGKSRKSEVRFEEGKTRGGYKYNNTFPNNNARKK